MTLENARDIANLTTHVEHQIQTLTERLTSFETQINTFVTLQNQVADLLTRIDNLENRIIDIETAGSGA